MQTRFIKLSTVALIMVMYTLGMTQIGTLRAGAPVQATDDVGSGTTLFGPCPPEGFVATVTAPSGTAAASGANPAGSAGSAAARPANGGPRAFVGIQLGTVDDCGAEVVGVLQDGPADKAGLQVGDIIVALDCVPLTIFGEPLGPVDNTSMATPAVGAPALSDCADMAGMGAMATPDASGAMPTNMLNPFAVQCLSALGMLPASATGAVATQAAGSDNLTVVDFLVCMVQSHQPGDVVLFTVERADQELNVPVTLGVASAIAGGTSAATQAVGGTGGTGGSTGSNATAAATPVATSDATAVPTMEGTVSVPGDATQPVPVPTLAATP